MPQSKMSSRNVLLCRREAISLRSKTHSLNYITEYLYSFQRSTHQANRHISTQMIENSKEIGADTQKFIKAKVQTYRDVHICGKWKLHSLLLSERLFLSINATAYDDTAACKLQISVAKHLTTAGLKQLTNIRSTTFKVTDQIRLISDHTQIPFTYIDCDPTAS